MCRPMPPTILPTVILVWAMAVPDGSAIAAARAAARRFLMACSLPNPAGALGFVLPKPYTSPGQDVEVGRNVGHLPERRIEQRTHQELLGIGQRLVRRPLLGGDHVLAARLEDFAKLLGRKLRPHRVVGFLPDDLGILVGGNAKVFLERRDRA